MQSGMIPSNNAFLNMPVFGNVSYQDDSCPYDMTMLNIFEFKYFRFDCIDGRVTVKIPPSAELSFNFEHRHMRISRSLYDMESYWISDSHPRIGAMCCWAVFPRLTAKRKRSDSDSRVSPSIQPSSGSTSSSGCSGPSGPGSSTSIQPSSGSTSSSGCSGPSGPGSSTT